MRAIGGIVRFGLAIVGLIICLVLVTLWSRGPGDPLDDTRIVAVIPSPSGREAAVLYLHHIANFSADVLALNLVRPPFPAAGSKASTGSEIIAVRTSRISGWRARRNEADTAVRDFIVVNWSGDVIDVCPNNAATLVRFDSQGFSHDYDKATLCAAVK